MRALRKAAFVASAVGAVLAASLPANAVDEVTVRRLAGADRFATAAEIARVTFSEREVNVVVARGDDFADALSGVNPAGSHYWGDGPGPVLLTRSDVLPQPTVDVIRELTPFDGIVMGTTDVVSARVARQVSSMVERSRRLGGEDRYDTNTWSYINTYQDEAEYPGTVGGVYTAFLASGADYADALTVGPLAYRQRLPLLLTAPDRLSPATKESLTYRRGHEHQIKRVVIVGGPGAVSRRVVRQIRVLDPEMEIVRLAGVTRQETAIEVLRYAESQLGWTIDHVNLVRGDGFADALAGGPHAGAEGAPMLLTAGVDDLGEVAREFLRSRAGTIGSIDVLGGESAVSEAVVADAQAAATP
jgi:putative cell wall-binding protein